MADVARAYRKRDAWDTERERGSQVYDTPNQRHRIALRSKPQESNNVSRYQESIHHHHHRPNESNYSQYDQRSAKPPFPHSERPSHMDVSYKYKTALEDRPTAATYGQKIPSDQESRRSRRSEASYTLKGNHSFAPRERGSERSIQDKKSSKSATKKHVPAPICTVLHCQHACQRCCPNCRAGPTQITSPMVTLAIHQPPLICTCPRNQKDMKTPSIAPSVHSRNERQLSRTGSFGIGQGVKQVASPPSRKSSVASQRGQESQSGQKEKDPIYNLIYSQNNMIRQITSELVKQREITKEVEIDLKALRQARERSEARADNNKAFSQLKEGDPMYKSFQGREVSQKGGLLSRHSRSQHSINVVETSPPEQYSPIQEEESNRGEDSRSQIRMKSAISKKSALPVADFERNYLQEDGRPKCSSTDNHNRKAKMKVYRNPLTSSTDKLHNAKRDNEKHHERCCLSNEKPKKPPQLKPSKGSKESLKIATPHLYQLNYCGSACKQFGLPFTGASGRKRLGLTAPRRPRPDPRPMHLANRQPGVVIDALADVIAKRLKIELRP